MRLNRKKFIIFLGLIWGCHAFADQAGRRYAENELHALPAIEITVGLENADIVGSDNRALQAAVDYVGNLGGGTAIKAGDSLWTEWPAEL